MTDRTCTMPECTRRHLAKGMCSLHYYRENPQSKHRKVERNCTQCGVLVMKYPAGNRKPFCTWACQLAYQRTDPNHIWCAKPPAPPKSTAIELHPNPQRSRRQPAKPHRQPKPRKFFAGTCRICRAPFLTTTTSSTCSNACADAKRLDDRRAAKDKRRALQVSAFVAPVHRKTIYQRDGWRCQICKRAVQRDAVVPHPLAPTLDHIIPLARGGTHEPANARLACFLCNATRGDRGGWEQLALIG